MATDENWHRMVTESIGGAESYGRGIWPNPWVEKQSEWNRRDASPLPLADLSVKIKMIFEPRFITGVETCELMERLITMIGAKKILELGMHTGFGTLHMLRAIYGIEGASVTSIDARPAHDIEYFTHPAIAKHFQFIKGWTPECLDQLAGQLFDFVFVDSAHDIEHTQKEVAAVLKITRSGSMLCFHDVPQWQTPSNRVPPPVRTWLLELIAKGEFTGIFLPSPKQLDAAEEWGDHYPLQCSPGLAVLIRK